MAGRYLVILDLGGYLLRLSDAPVTVDGEDYHEGSTLTSAPYWPDSLSLDIYAEPAGGWALWIGQRGPIEDRPVSVYWHTDGQTLAEARLVISGLLTDAEYGAAGEAMSCNVVRDVMRSTRPVPPPTSAIDPIQWSGAAEKALGKVPPLVIGYPGSYEGGGLRPVVPAHVVSSSGGVIAIAYGRIAADVVDVYRVEGGSGVFASWTGAGVFEVVKPLTGHTISCVDADGGSGGTAAPVGFIVDDGVYFTSHDLTDAGDNYGGITANPDSINPDAIRGAADVMRYLLEEYSDIAIDDARWEREAQWLNSYLLDGWIDDPIDVYDWITRVVIPMLPVVPRQGPGGLWLQPRRYTATDAQVRVELSADRREITRTSMVGRRDSIYTRFDVEYAYGQDRYHARRTLQDVSGVDRPQVGGYDSRTYGRLDLLLATQRFGVRTADPISAPITWDAPTATRILSDYADRHGWPHRSVQYVGGSALADLEPGQYVRITDTEVGIEAQIALIEEITVSVDDVTLDLTMLDGPAVAPYTPAVVVREETSVAPDGFASLRSWWDAFDSATYDGSGDLTQITDKGPDAANMVPDVVGMPRVLYDVGGTSVYLPGPATAWTEVPEAVKVAAIGDFTIVLLIPTSGNHSTQRCYFAIQKSFGYDLQVVAGSTAGEVDVLSATGTDATIDIGWDAAAADGAHAILIIRRSGSGLTLDCWYDQQNGGGMVHPAQVTATSTAPASIVSAGFALGGRGSITQVWDSSPVHMAAWHDEALADADVLKIARWAGARLDITGI